MRSRPASAERPVKIQVNVPTPKFVPTFLTFMKRNFLYNAPLYTDCACVLESSAYCIPSFPPLFLFSAPFEMDFLSLWHLAEIGLYGNKHSDGIAAQRGGSRAERPFSYSDAAEIALQGGWGGWPTGNGNKLSNSPACCLTQLFLAAVYILSISGGPSTPSALYSRPWKTVSKIK